MNRSTKKKGSKILLLINTLLSNYDIGTNFIKIAYLKAQFSLKSVRRLFV